MEKNLKSLKLPPEDCSVEEFEKNLRKVLINIVTSDEEKRDALNGDILEIKAVQDIISASSLDISDFRYNLIRPMDDLVDTILKKVAPNSPEARFLLKNSRYVDSQIRNVFQSLEGSACCADKTRTVMQALLAFYLKGKPISFNYSAQYIFQLPERVMKTQDEIVGFFEAVYFLHYGRPENFLKVMEDFGLSNHSREVTP
jgi:hypothetical protein